MPVQARYSPYPPCHVPRISPESRSQSMPTACQLRGPAPKNTSASNICKAPLQRVWVLCSRNRSLARGSIRDLPCELLNVGTYNFIFNSLSFDGSCLTTRRMPLGIAVSSIGGTVMTPINSDCPWISDTGHVVVLWAPGAVFHRHERRT
jgi:hypothetical protein